MFNDSETTVEERWISLSRDRTINLERQILFRNDELCVGETIWYQTRSHLTPITDLWSPLLCRRYLDNDLHEQGRRIIRLYLVIVWSLNPPAPSGAVGFSSNENKRFRTGYELEHSKLLLLELESGKLQERRSREANRTLEVYNQQRHGSAPFHFELCGVTNVDARRIGTINSMLCVPSRGLAFFSVLLKAELIGFQISKMFSDRQQKRIAQRDCTKFAFMLNVIAVQPRPRTRLLISLMAFLKLDNDRITLDAMFIEFLEFDNIEVVSRHQFWCHDLELVVRVLRTVINFFFVFLCMCTRIFYCLSLDPNLLKYFRDVFIVVKVISNSILVTIDNCISDLPPHNSFFDHEDYIVYLVVISICSFYFDDHLESSRSCVRIPVWLPSMYELFKYFNGT